MAKKTKRRKRNKKHERIYLGTYNEEQIMSCFARDDVNRKLAEIGKKDIEIDPLMRFNEKNGCKVYVGFKIYAV